MVRTILGVIAGYIVFSITLFVLLSILYMILGTSGSFRAGNYDLTMAWLLASVVIFFIGGAIAAAVCAMISKSAKAGLYMGGTIFVIGILMAIFQIAVDPGTVPREVGEIALLDAMNRAHGPLWSHFVNPIAAFTGALVGGGMLKNS